ncbi:MAG TPA: hypothetical protein VIX12_01410, partial [Candidatus Binataceae bacterium]
MSSKRRLAVVPTRPEDQARLKLDEAIKAAARAKAVLASHQAAISRAGEQLAASERRVEELRSGVDVARHAYEGELADAVARGAPLPATGAAVKAADAAVADAERTAEAVRVARDRLRSDARGHEIEAHLAAVAVAAAADAVLAPSVASILEAAAR